MAVADVIRLAVSLEDDLPRSLDQSIAQISSTNRPEAMPDPICDDLI